MVEDMILLWSQNKIKMEAKDLPKEFQKGFKVNYTELKKAVMRCELDKKSNECKKALQDLGIEVYGDN